MFGPALGWPRPPWRPGPTWRTWRGTRASWSTTSRSTTQSRPEETALRGCIFIDPPEKEGADAEISWWVVGERWAPVPEPALDALVPRWVAEDSPLGACPRYVGRDLTWEAWLALPDA